MKVRQEKARSKTFNLSDGQNLFLSVKPNGKKYWYMTYQWTGKQTSISLGVYPTVTLAAARAKRNFYKTKLSQGINPADERIGQLRERDKNMTTEMHYLYSRLNAKDQFLVLEFTRRLTIADGRCETMPEEPRNGIAPTLGAH
jgi:hypothetical protein